MLGVNLRPRTRAASQDRSMPAQHSRVYSKDEELGKRDDDFRPLRRTSMSASLMQPWRWRKRRLATVLAMIALVYLFWRQLASALNEVEERLAAGPGSPVGGAQGRGVEPIGAPPRVKLLDEEEEEESKHYYDGPIKFYRLAATLHSISKTMGIRPENRNVLYAVSSLQSAANLMPMACEMARWDRNYVHMAFLGRDPLSVDEILEVNGVSREGCTVYFHDARGDYSEYSTDKRAEVAVAGAMKHINDFVHPQAIVMDDSKCEDGFFTRAMRAKAKELDRALIEVPAGRYEEFIWMTRLDSASLRNWFRPTIDIVVHSPLDSSGGLIRLFRSLEEADYAGFAVPKLTVELPSNIEEFAKKYLERMQWPPVTLASPGRQQSTLTLRHRIPAAHLTSEAASVRFLESFYPAQADDNHVLVLSPQAEVGPLFLQYLMYVVLEYKYSSYASPEAHDLLGISLDVPAALLNGSGTFLQPLVAQMPREKYSEDTRYNQSGAPFRYQAPSATASLIFGDKWSTFHEFLSNRLTVSHSGKAQKTKKLVSETEPAWLEYLLELMRVRGWSILHPALPFVTVHNELAQVPGEFLRDQSDGKKDDKSAAKAEHPEKEAYLTADEPPKFTKHIERESSDYTPLHAVLPFEGDLPELSHLPYLSFAGERVNTTADTDFRTLTAPLFRRLFGGCSTADAARNRVVSDVGKTDDLFCLPGVEAEYVDDEEEVQDGADAAKAVIAETANDAEADDEETREERIAAMARVVGSRSGRADEAAEGGHRSEVEGAVGDGG